MMINDDDCDIEPLHETDFESGVSGEPPLGAGHTIEMTKLAAMSMCRSLCDEMTVDQANLNSWQSCPSNASPTE